jgi:predicted MFS family arabinose efflux permease
LVSLDLKKSSVRAAWMGTLGLFLVHGLVFSTWISRIPGVQIALRLTNASLGLALLGAAVGSVTAIPIAGVLVSKSGSRVVCIISTFCFCAALIGPGLAVDFWTLFLSLVGLGATAGVMDVAMNAQGVLVEERLGTPTMSRFHAMFSLGAMAGAAAGGAVAARHVPTGWHFLVASALLALASIPACWWLIESPPSSGSPEAHRVPFRNMPSMLLALSAIAFCILLSEGAMADWTAVYLRQTFHANPATAAWGYAAFSAAMAIVRLLGDHITLWLGNVRAVRYGSLLAALGVTFAIAAPSAAFAIPGFGAAGAGFSVIIPLVFGSSGRVPGVSAGAGIASVTGLGFIGFLVGPPAIGFTSQLITLRLSLTMVVALCLVATALAGYVDASPDDAVVGERLIRL